VPVLAGETHRAPFRKRRDAASTFCSRPCPLSLAPIFKGGYSFLVVFEEHGDSYQDRRTML